MGGESSKSEQPGLQQHDRLGPFTMKEIDEGQNQEKLAIMELSRSVQSEKNINDWLQNLDKINDSQTQETILIPNKHTFEKAGLCGSSGTVKLFYESFPYVLECEIENRSKLNRDFLETQMWYLLYSMVRAGSKFEKIKSKIGDVHPYNVLINDDGQIKLLSSCSMPGEITNFDKIVEDKQAKVYLAPEELNPEALAKGQYPANVDPCRAEVFSIGLTILASGILDDCKEVYKGFQKINEQKLNENLHRFRGKYSPYLFSVLCGMLAIRSSERRKCSDIFTELHPFEDNILDLEPFEVRQNYAPNTAIRPASFNQQQAYNLAQQPARQVPLQYQQYLPQGDVVRQSYQHYPQYKK